MGIQVTGLTKNKKQWEKEFIDFQFDGKYISEFGMVAVFDGDRHSFAASPSFENETSEINGAAGQLYWGTKLKTLKRTYTLATDGMTEKQINAFKSHFKPGKYGKFIEDKLMHRYGYCRVAEVIEFSVLPFRKKIKYLGSVLEVNEYKGEAKIVFEWDAPYTYSTINYIDKIDTLTKEIYNDIARAVYNNGVPFYSSWRKTFSNKAAALLGQAILGTMILGQKELLKDKKCHLGQDKCLEFNDSDGAVTSELVEDTGYVGAGLEDPMFFYNPSNISTPATITLSFVPSFTNMIVSGTWLPVYYNNIADDINQNSSNFSAAYNSIGQSSKISLTEGKATINGKEEIVNYYSMPLEKDYVNILNYTNPSVIYAINKTIKLAYNYYQQNGVSLIELEEKIREEITHDKVSKWAIKILSDIRKNTTLCKNNLFTTNTVNVAVGHLTTNGTTCKANWYAYFNIKMLEFMYNSTKKQFYSYTIELSGEHSETKIRYSHNQIDGTFFVDQEEFCGDIMLSPYLNLEGGDDVDETGNILSCHALIFKQGGQFDKQITATLQYKYTYL